MATTKAFFDLWRAGKLKLSVSNGPVQILEKRIYQPVIGWPQSTECEHCDGEHGRQTRLAYLRGYVCQHCDSALDEMLNEGSR